MATTSVEHSLDRVPLTIFLREAEPRVRALQDAWTVAKECGEQVPTFFREPAATPNMLFNVVGQFVESYERERIALL